MKKVWLVEFTTDDGDFASAVFLECPTQDELDDYIAEIDWLADEAEEGTLEWDIIQVDYVENER